MTSCDVFKGEDYYESYLGEVIIDKFAEEEYEKRSLTIRFCARAGQGSKLCLFCMMRQTHEWEKYVLRVKSLLWQAIYLLEKRKK